MSGQKSKRKGKDGERELSKILTNYFNDTFTRSPQSGAYIGGSNNKRKEFLHEGTIRVFKGDIIPPENFSKMVIEVKSYEKFPFHLLLCNDDISLLDNEKSGWISQIEETLDTDDIWFLFFKVKNKGWYIVFHKDNISFLSMENINYCLRKKYIVTELHSFLKNNTKNLTTLCM